MRGPPQGEAHGDAPLVASSALSALLHELAIAPARPLGDFPAFHAGDVVGRFEIVREIGRGGFGVVFEARDLELGRAVALKALRAGARPGAGSTRLLQEAEAAARLSHPNIVTLYDVGRCEQGLYLVLELLRGETLARRLERGPVPAGEALRIAIQVAAALAHAHANGVVHRDLTPGNVFVCEGGHVKVLDFGMAHAFGRRKVDGGTPAFMAPEQSRGAPEDERTDVFALGAILYRLLANALPPSRSPRRGAAPALRLADAPKLAELVERMIRLDPVERPRDGGAVLAELIACQRELASRSAAGSSAPPARRRRERGADGASRERGRRRSIAVLPFVSLSRDREQEYFSDGLAEEILNALAQVPRLHVVGRSSSFAFKGKTGDLRAIGQQLGATTVLEGSVRKSGTRVRVSAQLVDVTDGFHLWSQRFDRELSDIFAVQDEIARAVVTALEVKLRPGRTSGARRATHGEAFRHLLLGRQQFNLDTADGYRHALEEFDRALAVDPGYPPALGWRGVTAYMLAEAEETTPEDLRTALDAVDRAVAMAPDLAELRSLRGWIRTVFAWDWAGAKADLERALALAPGDAPTQTRYAHLLATLGRPEQAIPIARKVTEIDPLSADAWWNLCSFYNATGQLGLAEAGLLRARSFAPTHLRLVRELGFTYLLQGRPAEALALFEEHGMGCMRFLGTSIAQHELGRADASRRALELLVARHAETSAFQIAQVHAWRGEPDLAFEWLERAHANRDPGLHYVKYDPLLRNLRGDPRYIGVLRRMRLPVD